MESERDGSTACFEFGFKPQEQCREAADRQRLRCCNSDLVLNKFKMYVGELVRQLLAACQGIGPTWHGSWAGPWRSLTAPCEFRRYWALCIPQ